MESKRNKDYIRIPIRDKHTGYLKMRFVSESDMFYCYWVRWKLFCSWYGLPEI